MVDFLIVAGVGVVACFPFAVLFWPRTVTRSDAKE